MGMNTESVYDWENEQWTMPFNVSISQLLKLDHNRLSSVSVDVPTPSVRVAVPIGDAFRGDVVIPEMKDQRAGKKHISRR